MDYLQEARDVFKNDIFATETTGITIEDAGLGYGRCSMQIAQKHMNAGNSVMGGAIFTLADLAFGIAANVGQMEEFTTVTLDASINYLGVAKGEKLIAEAHVRKAGRSTCVVQIDIADELGTQVAVSTMTGFRKRKKR